MVSIIDEWVNAASRRGLLQSANSMIIEVTGHENTIDSLTRLLKDYGVVELVRTGRVSMLRGS